MTDPRQRATAQAGAGFGSAAERDRLLARRRLALIVLLAAVPITLVAAILTGSTVFLLANLVCDVLIAGYVALLLQIKQTQDRRSAVPARPRQGVPVRR